MKVVLLSIPEVARRLAVSRWTVYRYIDKNILKVVRLPDGRMRINEAELQRFIKQLSSFAQKLPGDIDAAQAQVDFYNKMGYFPKS